MLSNSILALVASAAVGIAQTIETSTVASMEATTTVAQAMPPVATQGFDAGAVNDTVRCKYSNASTESRD
jgi:hypothetical protein